MKKKKILHIVYHNGTLDGIRICMSPLSAIRSFLIPRSCLDEAYQLMNGDNPGIYFLVNHVGGALTNLYVGQTDGGIARLEDHNTKHDFWNNAILFLAERQTFTPGLVSGLEEYAIRRIRAATRHTKCCVLDNRTIPRGNAKEYGMQSVKEVYEEIEFIMAALGYPLPGADGAPATGTATPLADSAGQAVMRREAPAIDLGLLIAKRRSVFAFGRYDGNVFVLQSESEIDFANPAGVDSCNRRRQDLLADGTIVKRSDGRYFLVKSIEFGKPSEASTFVMGGTTNGWMEWRDQQGRTLDELVRGMA